MSGRKDLTALQAQVSGDATVYEKIIGRFRKPRLSREQALEARPIRNPALQWKELDNGEVQVILPRRRDAIGKLLSAVFYIPPSRPVNLDVVGARVWKLCDGNHTVNAIAKTLMEEHKLHRREAEVSLTEFLKMLGKRNMVGFIVPTEYIQMDQKSADDSSKRSEQKTLPGSGGKRRKGKR